MADTLGGRRPGYDGAGAVGDPTVYLMRQKGRDRPPVRDIKAIILRQLSAYHASPSRRTHEEPRRNLCAALYPFPIEGAERASPWLSVPDHLIATLLSQFPPAATVNTPGGRGRPQQRTASCLHGGRFHRRRQPQLANLKQVSARSWSPPRSGVRRTWSHP